MSRNYIEPFKEFQNASCTDIVSSSCNSSTHRNKQDAKETPRYKALTILSSDNSIPEEQEFDQSQTQKSFDMLKEQNRGFIQEETQGTTLKTSENNTISCDEFLLKHQ